MTIREAAAGLRARRFSAVELTTAALARIERHNASLRAFITVTADQALEQARQADRELAAGTTAARCTASRSRSRICSTPRACAPPAGSKVYENFVPDHNATVVEKLLAAGAVMLGKLNMHELAYGITSANPHFGAVRNPWNPQHSPGGSSGGPARRWRRRWFSWRWAAIPAVRFVSPRRFAGRSDSSPPTDGSAASGRCRWAAAWTTWVR